MSRRSNPSIIGAFVIGSLALAVAGLITFGSGDMFRTKMEFVCYFHNSVQGLNVGAPVKFRGVRIGSVAGINAELDAERGEIRIPVHIQIEPDLIVSTGERGDADYILREMIDRGLRARLELQSFVTGLLFIDFDFHPDSELKMVGTDSDMDELPTIPSSLEELTQVMETIVDALDAVSAESMIADVAATLRGIEQLVNSPATQGSAEKLHSTLETARATLEQANTSLVQITQSLETTLGTTREFVTTAEARVNSVSDQVETSLATATDEWQQTLVELRGVMERTDARLEPTLRSLTEVANRAVVLLEDADVLVRSLESESAPGSTLRYELSTTLDEVSRAAEAIALLAAFLERNPEALLRGKSGDN